MSFQINWGSRGFWRFGWRCLKELVRAIFSFSFLQFKKHDFLLKLHKHIVDYETSSDFPPVLCQVDDWIFIFGWTYPLTSSGLNQKKKKKKNVWVYPSLVRWVTFSKKVKKYFSKKVGIILLQSTSPLQSNGYNYHPKLLMCIFNPLQSINWVHACSRII